MQRLNASSAGWAPSSVNVRDVLALAVTCSRCPLANWFMNAPIIVFGVPRSRTMRRKHLTRLPGWSPLAKAMRYAISHWSGLILYLDDGRLEMDTNVVERALRPAV